ncbi:hypothetical protein ACIBCT_00155 [Streptosporangium sp. NPDC050855]|uniref:hypothetical protein n=1 Tax=Streptosporangium sp. NPDC050855 TaxID=3366194 RepID=UPI003799D72C
MFGIDGIGTQSYCGQGVVKQCLGEGTQMRPGPQLTSAQGDPGLHVPVDRPSDTAAVRTSAAVLVLSPHAAVTVAGDPAAATTTRAGISFRSIFPPVIMIGSSSPAMLAPAVPANGKTTLSREDGLPKRPRDGAAD